VDHLLHDQRRELRIILEEPARLLGVILPEPGLEKAYACEYLLEEGVIKAYAIVECLAGFED